MLFPPPKNGDEVVRENRCPDCGRIFQLRYMKTTGKACQTWQRGCETMDECIRKHMPPSDFTPHDKKEGQG